MYHSLLAVLPLLASMASETAAHPVIKRYSPVSKSFKREVPQEHSHEQFLTTLRTFLNMNNPQGIVDPVFGLLGNAAASAGQGSVTDTDCLQQATADQAFTNSKAAGDVTGMTAALIYRALERNTGAVGLASVHCNETATNPEIQAISQHQDPASDGAAATNKAITLALAQQIASVGGDPQDALKSGTFAPGTIGDPTAAGNTCDDANDAEGCIFTQNLLVEDATADEITAAVAGISATSVTAISTVASTVTAAFTASTTAAACVLSDTTSSAPAVATSSATTNTAVAAGIDVGPCTDFSMTFAAGLAGRQTTEFSFEPTDLTNFNHGTALNPAIIAQFMCDTFVNACARSASTRDTCYTVMDTINADLTAGTLAKDQSYANAWLFGLEEAFGITSTGTGTEGTNTIAEAEASSALAGATFATVTTEAASTDAATSTAVADTSTTASTTESAAVTATSSAATNAAAAGIDVGPCADFSMTFATGLAGRQATEFSFEPTDLTNFNHGTALNPEIIAQFMCDTFVNACAKSATTRDTCYTVMSTINAELDSGALAKDQTYADAWLSGLEEAFGIQSSGTGTGSGSASTSASNSTTAAEVTTSAASTVAAASDATTSSPAAAATSSTPAAASGTNIQTFTGALNGATAPAVTQGSGTRPFTVNGNTFVNAAAAIQRSCAIQNNACANAFNAGMGTSSVGDCSAQEEQCNAAFSG